LREIAAYQTLRLLWSPAKMMRINALSGLRWGDNFITKPFTCASLRGPAFCAARAIGGVTGAGVVQDIQQFRFDGMTGDPRPVGTKIVTVRTGIDQRRFQIVDCIFESS
jgi:hypothetical protein